MKQPPVRYELLREKERETLLVTVVNHANNPGTDGVGEARAPDKKQYVTSAVHESISNSDTCSTTERQPHGRQVVTDGPVTTLPMTFCRPVSPGRALFFFFTRD